MAMADLHVHSRHSTHPSTWFLQRLGTRESYVDPEHIYEKAMKEGMDFVTITDHNCIDGALLLKEKYPDNVLTGLEATTYFPEDGAKIHILVWGLTAEQFNEIENRRQNIYELRSYLTEQNLAHAVAHATYSLNRVLTIEHVERLMVLFDCFEGINGSRNRSNNEALLRTLSSLTPAKIKALSRKYGIRPNAQHSWRKGMVGGSDDHSGLFIGKTYTIASAQSVDEFLHELQGGHVAPGGRHNDYKGLALAIYKVAYDFSKSRGRALTTSLFSAVNALIFDQRSMGLSSRLALKKIKLSKRGGDDDVKNILQELIDDFKSNGNMPIENKLAMLDDKITRISDAFFKGFFQRLAQNFKDADIINTIRSISAALPGIFLSAPFFTTLHLLNESRSLSDQLIRTYASTQFKRRKRVLWFSDTLSDLNGVSATLVKVAKLARDKNLDLRLVGCMTEEENAVAFPPNVIKLPCLLTYTPSYFKTYTLRFPSVLASLKMIYDADPDEIYISTPGPVGMLGLLVSKLLHIPTTGIYHTDFTLYAKQIIGDDFICKIVEDSSIWFYSMVDTVAVPTYEYIDILGHRGYDKKKMVKFKRGIDARLFSPKGPDREYLKQYCPVEDGITLVYSGRVSKEKNVDFLARVYRKIAEDYQQVNLLFAGDGPYLEEFTQAMSDCKRVHFLGRVAREKLPWIYSACDAMLFPSVTDTFGMVILEAQACSLPAIVSDFGGPKEIIVNGRTGFIAQADNIDDWVDRTKGMIDLILKYPDLYMEMRQNARDHVVNNYNWDLLLKDIFSDSPLPAKKAHAYDYGQNRDDMRTMEQQKTV